MKKQIAALASIIIISGLSTFDQDWINIGDSKGGVIQDDFSVPGVPQNAYSGDVTVEVLWAKTGILDPYDGSTAATGGATVQPEITALLGAGWTLTADYSSGTGNIVVTTATGTAATAKGAGGVAG
jgi:hypothetical protein